MIPPECGVRGTFWPIGLICVSRESKNVRGVAHPPPTPPNVTTESMLDGNGGEAKIGPIIIIV